MQTSLITIYHEGIGIHPKTGFIISEDGWKFIRNGHDNAIFLLDDALHKAIEFLEDLPSERKTPPPEPTCLPKPRPCPPYYEILPGVGLARLIGGWTFFLGVAAKYLFRAGKKPGNRAQEDLRKAVDYLLMEIDRLDALDRQRYEP